MGNAQQSCHNLPFSVTHACDLSLHDYGFVENFCTLSGPAGNKYRSRVCSQMGPEFQGSYRETWNCHYNDCGNMQAMKLGCCKHPAHCCGISGHGVACKRNHFYGEPAECCLRNSTCKHKKWDSPTDCQDRKGFTCSDGRSGAEDHRTLTGQDCRKHLRDYFLGVDASMDATLRRWTDTSERGALYFLERVTRKGANCPGGLAPSDYPMNPEGVLYASELVKSFMKRFNKEAHPPSVKWSYTYHPVQELLYDYGLRNPAVMHGVLSDACAGLTEDDLKESEDVTRWCGCHLGRHNYETYSETYGLQPECARPKGRSLL